MELNDEELKIQDEAVKWINDKKNQQVLIQNFILDKKALPIPFIAIFMAGSPGVGKTEYSEEYIKDKNTHFAKIKKEKNFIRLSETEQLYIKRYENSIVRLDADEIRKFIPQYQKTDEKNNIQGNAHIVQKAVNKGVEILRNYCIENKVSFLLDGTFGNQFSTFDKMIKKLLKQNRNIVIFLLFGDFRKSWEFTKAREYEEGRNIKKEKFIGQYFKSLKNLKRIKEKFGDDVKVDLILKKEDNKIEKIYFNKTYVEIENILEKRYNISKITEKYLEDNLK